MFPAADTRGRSLHPAGCEVYAFCGALFGICSMMTLMVIAVDRYVVITRPLASLGGMSRRKALSIVAVAWLYSVGWSLPPFFGWSEYDLDGESPGNLLNMPNACFCGWSF